MSNVALAQVLAVAVAVVVLVGVVGGIVALITILRRRRMALPDEKPTSPHTAVAETPAPIPQPEAPLPTEFEKPVLQPITLDPSEPASLTIEPDVGPTEHERHIYRLIEHLKSEGEKPDEQDQP